MIPLIKGKILVGAPICQEPIVLSAFLRSLNRLETPEHEVFYHFIDDNYNPLSKKYLEDFQKKRDNVVIRKEEAVIPQAIPYVNHNWTQNKIWKVAAYKDSLIARARQEGFDYLFLIDSDLLLYPKTLAHLVNTGKDIISEIFWTKWSGNAIEQPQVWLSDSYTQYKKIPGEKLTREEEKIRTLAFYKLLRQPGIYPVGGLGACTLISKNAFEKDISFQKISNLSLWGEDRHFCVRACVLNIGLFVDTHYPAYHVYRPSELENGLDFLKKTEPGKEK